MNSEQYHALTSLSASIIKTLLQKSAMHARLQQTTPIEPSAVMLKDGKTEAELIARQGKQVAMITAEKFEESVGCKPENDDLDRCNCIEAGHIGHFQCGWDDERDMPVFIPGISKIAQNGEKTK